MTYLAAPLWDRRCARRDDRAGSQQARRPMMWRDRRRNHGDRSALSSAVADHAHDWVVTVLARPLFSPDRRPPADTVIVASGRTVPGLPRLAAILVGPFGRSAIFALMAPSRSSCRREAGRGLHNQVDRGCAGASARPRWRAGAVPELRARRALAPARRRRPRLRCLAMLPLRRPSLGCCSFLLGVLVRLRACRTTGDTRLVGTAWHAERSARHGSTATLVRLVLTPGTGLVWHARRRVLPSKGG